MPSFIILSSLCPAVSSAPPARWLDLAWRKDHLARCAVCRAFEEVTKAKGYGRRYEGTVWRAGDGGEE